MIWGGHDALRPMGIQAARIAGLWWRFFGVIMTAFILVMAAWVVALFKGGWHRPGPPEVAPDEIPPKDRLEHPVAPLNASDERLRMVMTALAGGVTILLLLILLSWSAATGHALNELDQGEGVTVTVTGHQWWWNLRYGEEKEPSLMFRTANELHIPVGRPVALSLQSADVIHSFWVPELQGKRDLIPGHANSLVLRADKPGVYRGQCAEFCGYEHAKMGFLVIADPPEEFSLWEKRMREPGRAPQTDEERRGQKVFMTHPCVMCHTIAGTTAGGTAGPDLTHFASRTTLAAATIPNDPGHLGGWIANAQGIKPGAQMPSIGLEPRDLQAVITYLRSLK